MIFELENGIFLYHSSNYYPQGNGLAESTNKNVIRIIQKNIYYEKSNCHNLLVNALWDERVTPKTSLKTSPYFIMYEKEAILPPNIYLLALQLSQKSQGKPCLVVHGRIKTLLKLEEERQKTK